VRTDMAQPSNSIASADLHRRARPDDVQEIICDNGGAGRRRSRKKPCGRRLKVSPGANTDPLHWWRKLEAGQFGESERTVIGAVLDRVALIHHEQAKAFAGELSEIVPLFAETAKSFCFNSRTDLVMTALLRCALGGNSTAKLLMRKALSKGSAFDPTLYQLSQTWFRHRQGRSDVP
jgi:hypothetical protein